MLNINTDNNEPTKKKNLKENVFEDLDKMLSEVDELMSTVKKDRLEKQALEQQTKVVNDRIPSLKEAYEEIPWWLRTPLWGDSIYM